MTGPQPLTMTMALLTLANGADLGKPDPEPCPGCGATIDADHDFCPHCGHDQDDRGDG